MGEQVSACFHMEPETVENREICMMRALNLVFFIFILLMAEESLAQIQSLPDNAQTKWIVNHPEEIVSYLIFDPATVKDRLPSSLRFITIEELAAYRITWADEHLKKCPAHAGWGISFIEIVRMGTFEIDGNKPAWPENGAAALWFARVASSDPKIDLGPGRPFLALEFWLPDKEFVDYMCEKGHYAGYGDVRLHKNPEGKWLGFVEAEGLNLSCECMPAGEIEETYSGGRQVFFPPAESGVKSIVRVAFAGHKIQQCREDGFWRIEGVHPLAGGVLIGPSTFQSGYDLVGGAYLH